MTNRLLIPRSDPPPDVDREAKTPRISGSYAVFLTGASTLSRLCDEAAMVYRKHPLHRSRRLELRCETVSELASAMAESFDAWTREPPTTEERGAQIDALMALREEARPMLEAIGLDLGKA